MADYYARRNELIGPFPSYDRAAVDHAAYLSMESPRMVYPLMGDVAPPPRPPMQILLDLSTVASSDFAELLHTDPVLRAIWEHGKQQGMEIVRQQERSRQRRWGSGR